MTDSTGLLVPIDLSAFCVGELDVQVTVGEGFTGVQTDFTALSEHSVLLSERVVRPLNAPPMHGLERGVHLHWALPDSLTKGAVTKEGLAFPATPNRWMVTRFALQQGKILSTKRWIVESDALHAPGSGEGRVSLPVQETQGEAMSYHLLGRSQEFSVGWSESSSGFQATMGRELNIVTSGVAAFAAFYPNCPNVFGLHDDLKDLPGAAELMYALDGWYDASASDPLRNGKSLEALEKDYGWTFAGDAKTTPDYTLLHGVLQQVAWDPKRDYIRHYNEPQQKPLQATVAIGNNAAEAFSAYFKHLDPGLTAETQQQDAALFETLFNAFQLGLLNVFHEPLPNQMEALHARLRGQQFRAVEAGTLWTLTPIDETQPIDAQAELIDLPLPLADDLNRLNLLQTQYDRAVDKLEELLRQLFADWYRIYAAKDTDTMDAAANVARDHYNNVYLPLADGEASALKGLENRLTAQKQKVEAQLDGSLLLKAVAAPRFYQPAEPVVLIAGNELQPPKRYGGDGQFHDAGYLACRLSGSLLTAVTVNGHTVRAADFPAAALPGPNKVPHGKVHDALLEEACLLNTTLLAGLTGVGAADLNTALQQLLRKQTQTLFAVTGEPPSPIGMNGWGTDNPWLPLLLSWEVDFAPMQPTVDVDGVPQCYPTDLFTSHYTVDNLTGGTIRYAPQGGGVFIDPATAAYTQSYQGETLLLASPAARLASQLKQDPHAADGTLKTIAQLLQSGPPIVVQPLSGFANALLARAQQVQLPPNAPSDDDYSTITKNIAAAVGDRLSVGLSVDGPFNPVRSGYLKLKLQVIDVFGQRRPVEIAQSGGMLCAESMRACDAHQQPVPGVAYLEPRLAQPSRLVWRWLAADATGYEEMNAHPAASPICGWLLPDHLQAGFFLYNPQGEPLGTLTLNGEQTAVVWQSAPGNDRTIDLEVAEALQAENPQLCALAVALKGGQGTQGSASADPASQQAAAFFYAFWSAIVTAQNRMAVPHAEADSGLSVLVGRPLALVQAALRLELQADPALDPTFAALSANDGNDSDAGLTGVRFPVILGDLAPANEKEEARFQDGLTGYFQQNDNGYDLSTFYAATAETASQSGVVPPMPTTVQLTPAPGLRQDPSEPADLHERTRKFLMLVDPRVPVQVTPGILPSKRLDLPPDLTNDALSRLEVYFLVAPLLQGASGLQMPLPQEQDYLFSWVTETHSNGKSAWQTASGLGEPNSTAGLGAYTPQRIVEDWLRMNPVLLEFALHDAQGRPIVKAGANDLDLVLTNRKPTRLVFPPGDLKAEGEPNRGAIFYLHFGDLVPEESIGSIVPDTPGWRFDKFTDTRYGTYWAATPTEAVTLESGRSLSLKLRKVQASPSGTQAQVAFDYYNVTGTDDDVYTELLTVLNKTMATVVDADPRSAG